MDILVLVEETSVVSKVVTAPVVLTVVTVWSAGVVVPLVVVVLKLKKFASGDAPVVAAAEAGVSTGGTTLLLLLVSVASVVVAVWEAVTTMATLPLSTLLVRTVPVVVTMGVVVTAVMILLIPSVVWGGRTPAEVVTMGPEKERLELIVELAVWWVTAALELGPELCCSVPDLFSIWPRKGVFAWGICPLQLAFSSTVNFGKARDFDMTVHWNLKGL